jgi:hypothetical protein
MVMILIYSWSAILGMIIIGMWLGNKEDNDSMYY